MVFQPTTVADCKSFENTEPCMSMTKVNLDGFAGVQRPTDVTQFKTLHFGSICFNP